MAVDSNWNMRIAVAVQSSKVPSNQANYPILLTHVNVGNGTDSMFDADGLYPANADGGDIRVTSDEAGVSELAVDIVYFLRNNNPTLGRLEMHVKHPNVLSASNTTVYVWWNNSGATMPLASATYGSENVWTNNYDAVYHCQETNPSGANSIKDSTSNDNHLTPTGTVTNKDSNWGSGIKGFQFASLAYASKDTTKIPVDDSFSLECIAQVGTGNPAVGLVWIGDKDASWKWSEVGFSANPNVRAYTVGYGASAQYAEKTLGTQNTWIHSFATFTGTAERNAYLNGAGPATDTDSINSGYFTHDRLVMNARLDTSSEQNSQIVCIDEARVSDVKRATNWIVTQGNNHTSPSTFAIEGIAEFVGVAGVGAGRRIPRGVARGILKGAA